MRHMKIRARFGFALLIGALIVFLMVLPAAIRAQSNATPLADQYPVADSHAGGDHLTYAQPNAYRRWFCRGRSQR